jgi:hypothetical protein
MILSHTYEVMALQLGVITMVPPVVLPLGIDRKIIQYKNSENIEICYDCRCKIDDCEFENKL